MQRYKDLIAPRSIPAANLPKGPHDRYFKNSYFERDGRRLVVPPKVTFQNPELAPPGTKLPGTVPIAQLTGRYSFYLTITFFGISQFYSVNFYEVPVLHMYLYVIHFSGEVPKESRSSIVTPGLVYRWDWEWWLMSWLMINVSYVHSNWKCLVNCRFRLDLLPLHALNIIFVEI